MSVPENAAEFPRLTSRRLRQLWYLPILGGGMALLMARMLVMARLLDVPSFGHYSMGLLIATLFGMLGCLGLYPLLQRDMPMLLARHRGRRALVLLMQALLVGCACAALLAALGALRLTVAGLSGGLLALAVLNGLSQQLFLVVTTESRSAGEPLRYARQHLWRAVAMVATTAAVAAATRDAGAVLATEAVISLAVSGAILLKAAHGRGFHLRLLARAAARQLQRLPWHSALVFLGISATAAVLSNLDRWLGAELLSPEAFGQYAFAGITVLIAQSLQSMVGASLYPMVTRRFALAGPLVAYRLAATVSLGLLAAGAVAGVPAYFAAQWAIARWYPGYAAGAQLLPALLAVAVLRIADFWSTYLAASGNERPLLATSVGVGVAGCALWALAISLRGARPVSAGDIALLALVLSAGTHIAAAVVARRASRTAGAAAAREATP
jgi:O-antigen/teichoic acid export membrane protein